MKLNDVATYIREFALVSGLFGTMYLWALVL